MTLKNHFQKISKGLLVAATMLLCMAGSSARTQVQTLPGPVQDDRVRERELIKAKEAEEAARRAHELQRRAVRVRLEPVAPAPAPVGPPGGGIFVPTPKDQTLDNSVSLSADTNDKVTTDLGDLLIGKVIDIEAGKLRFTAPHYEGEVCIFTESLNRVQLAGKAQPSGPSELLLTNGDYIRGPITAITPDLIVIESDVSGPISISRKVVSSIKFDGARQTSLSSDFDSGNMEPWKARAGDWSVKDQQLVISSGGNRDQAVYAELDQSEALIFVAKVKAVQDQQLYCYLVAFADNIQGYYGRNSVFAEFRSSNCRIGYCQNGNDNMPSGAGLNRRVQEAILRFAYDPATGQATTWVDSDRIDQHTIGPKPTTGKYVIFVSRYPCQVSYLRVLRGIVPPSEGVGGEDKPQTETHTVEFTNSDSISSSQVLLTEGTFLAETAHGELRCPLEKVQNITFATTGQETPRRNKGDVLVEMPAGRLTFQFDKLGDEYLLGSCEHLGQVKLLRSGVRSVGFNIYKK